MVYWSVVEVDPVDQARLLLPGKLDEQDVTQKCSHGNVLCCGATGQAAHLYKNKQILNTFNTFYNAHTIVCFLAHYSNLHLKR